MAEVSPTILQRFYSEATASDNFVAGPSGVAYTFPDAILNETSFAEWTLQYMQRAGLTIVNVIASSDCDAECASPYVDAGAEAVFLYTYGYAQLTLLSCRLFGFLVRGRSRFSRDYYCGRGAKLTWVSGTPVVGGRMALW
jgi:hypothetical protein